MHSVSVKGDAAADCLFATTSSARLWKTNSFISMQTVIYVVAVLNVI